MSVNPPPPVTRVLGEPLSEAAARELARLFKVIGDPARLRLLNIVASRPGGRACNCQLIEPVGLAQPTISHHLNILVEAGLMIRERRGQWVDYQVVREALDALRDALEATS